MSEAIVVTDAGGRKITVQPLDPADMLDLMEAVGNASSNVGYVRYAMVICAVTMVDDVPVPRASKKAEIKALARKLGNDGFSAVAKELFGDDTAADSSEVETAKN